MVENTVPSVQQKKEVTDKENTRSQGRYYFPAVDIFDHKNELIVIADVPGVDKENIKIRVEEGILTLEATHSDMSKGEPFYREFEWGNFYRQFKLSDEIDDDNISAEVKNGVLTIHLPKTEKASKLIDVKIT